MAKKEALALIACGEGVLAEEPLRLKIWLGVSCGGVGSAIWLVEPYPEEAYVDGSVVALVERPGDGLTVLGHTVGKPGVPPLSDKSGTEETC